MSYGSYFIMGLMVFIVGVGFYGFSNTTYEIKTFDHPEIIYDNKESDVRFLNLFSSNFSPLAGQLGIGYFLHTVSLPIIKNNEK